jgi:CBS domain containing-hemolysin-like protein
VVDEYGSVAGIVTMEDLIEEVLGEIRDEYEIEMDFKLLPDGTLEAPGDFDLDNLREYLDYRPPPGTQSSTLGGLAIEWSGRVPAQDSVIEKNGLSLTILKADALGVDRVLVKRLPEEGGARESNGT